MSPRRVIEGREDRGGHKKRPPLMTPLEWPESAIPRPWAMANGDGHPFTHSLGRRTTDGGRVKARLGSPPITRATRSRSASPAATATQSSPRARKSGKSACRIWSGRGCGTTPINQVSAPPPSLTESAHSWHAARTQTGAGEILNVAERGSSQSSNFNVALCMPYSRSLSL